MIVNKIIAKQLVWVSGCAGSYRLNIDSSVVELNAGRLQGVECVFAGEILLKDYRTAIAMQRLFRDALVGMELPEVGGR